MIDYQQLGMRIKLIRKKQNLTQQELADRTTLSASYIGHIERGFKRCSLDALVEICLALNLDVNFVLFGIDPSQNQLTLICRDLEIILKKLKTQL